MNLADQIAEWIASYVRSAKAEGVVLGLSGGIDSAVVSGLCARSLGADKVLGLIMPCHSLPEDVADAELVAKTWGIAFETHDLSELYDNYVALLPEGNVLAKANLKPRLRMITLYYRAASLGRLVVGTGNRSELMVGYYTKYGDGGVDLLPIAGLFKGQVRELARQIGVPERIIERPPSAGLWAGQTDEEELGITYEDLDRTLAAIASGQTSDIEGPLLDRVQRMIAVSEHKRGLPPIFTPSAAA
jgi:NAD+ synthase